MAKSEKQGIEKIEYGRIDFYVPLKFETKLDFKKICKRINCGIEEKVQKHYSIIQQDGQNIQADIEDDVIIETCGKLSLFRKVKKVIREKRRSGRKIISREDMNNVIKIGVTDSGLRIEFLLEELESYYGKRNKINNMYDKYKEICGLKFTNSQERFVLFPVHIQLNNDEYVWLNAILFVFQNKMGILKIELPLSNVLSQPLMDYQYNGYIKRINNPWMNDMIIEGNTIEDLQNAYMKIIGDYGIKVKQVGHSFRNILLSNFTGMPKQINNISNKVLVDLYRIIAAPVTIMPCTTYENEASKYVIEHQWGKHNCKYICSTTGGCLSITDIDFVDFYFKKYQEQNEIDELEELEARTVYEQIVGNLCLNVEYAIIIIVLKYMTKEYFYKLKVRKPQDMHEVKKEYNINVMYISELQEQCFGTVSEQIEIFEKAMPYYLKENLTTDKLNAIDAVLADEENNRYTSLQNIISVGGLIMTSLFGLPAVYETISMIRRICIFINRDIPIVTVENISLVVWAITSSLIAISVLCRWIGKKRRSILERSKWR